MNDNNILKAKMINLVNNTDDKTWFTIPEFEAATGSTSTDIIQVINSNDEFVKSNRLNSDNLSRYSTREEFNKSTSIFTKLRGAFKDTID